MRDFMIHDYSLQHLDEKNNVANVLVLNYVHI
ncbi:MAG: hypothetical protein ACI9OH_001414 [Oleispira sp.]|jgi:hypothetical protein